MAPTGTPPAAARALPRRPPRGPPPPADAFDAARFSFFGDAPTFGADALGRVSPGLLPRDGAAAVRAAADADNGEAALAAALAAGIDLLGEAEDDGVPPVSKAEDEGEPEWA